MVRVGSLGWRNREGEEKTSLKRLEGGRPDLYGKGTASSNEMEYESKQAIWTQALLRIFVAAGIPLCSESLCLG